jgi:hypothetical protein
VFIITAKAQEETIEKEYGTIITDRPDQTESSALVPKQFLQVETGAFYETLELNNIKSKTATFNTTLLRYGLLDNLELRVGFSNSEVRQEFNGNNLKGVASGFSPLSIGVKIGVSEEKGLLPKIAFLSHVNFPFLASQDFKTKSTSIDFRFSFSHTLNEKSSLGYNIGMFWGGDITTANYVYTLAYGYSISDKVGAFLEIYGDQPEDSHFNHLWDAGFTYLINDNIQLDISGGTGITQNIQDFFLSAGISFRLPK